MLLPSNGLVSIIHRQPLNLETGPGSENCNYIKIWNTFFGSPFMVVSLLMIFVSLDTYLLFLLVTSVCKARRLFFVYCVIVIPLARCSSSWSLIVLQISTLQIRLNDWWPTWTTLMEPLLLSRVGFFGKVAMLLSFGTSDGASGKLLTKCIFSTQTWLRFLVILNKRLLLGSWVGNPFLYPLWSWTQTTT